MAQRVLAAGEIESLAHRSIPRVRIPDAHHVFAARAARLQALSASSAMGGYLEFLAQLVEAQHAVLPLNEAMLPARDVLERAAQHRMPPIVPAHWMDSPGWRTSLRHICTRLQRGPRVAPPIRDLVSHLARAEPEWLQTQGRWAITGDASLDVATAPFIMAALQVEGVALASQFTADAVAPLDTPGVCPLCGSAPVASIVYANPPYQGYRYLHCSLCATEWHRVRVQCTHCGTSGKDIALHHVTGPGSIPPQQGVEPAIRAETCDACLSYRKIFYQEWDMGVEPIADDVASIALDVLLGEKGYHRIDGNPLLWQGRAS